MSDLQRIQFSFKGPGFGRIGLCPVEVRTLGLKKVLVVFTENGNTGCGTVYDSIAAIATQFKLKHLRTYEPASITWVVHSPAGRDEDHSYQKITLSWDGERFDIP